MESDTLHMPKSPNNHCRSDLDVRSTARWRRKPIFGIAGALSGLPTLIHIQKNYGRGYRQMPKTTPRSQPFTVAGSLEKRYCVMVIGDDSAATNRQTTKSQRVLRSVRTMRVVGEEDALLKDSGTSSSNPTSPILPPVCSPHFRQQLG